MASRKMMAYFWIIPECIPFQINVHNSDTLQCNTLTNVTETLEK